MRLVCPNCGAQYEVDDRVIPDNGRDVQCSSCGHAWYQMPAHLEADEEPVPSDLEEALGPDDDAITGDEEEDETEGVTGEPEVPAAAEADAVAPEETVQAASERATDAALAAAVRDATLDEAPEPEPEPAPETEPDENDEEDDEEDAGAMPADAAAPRRALDENLRAILQEEVAREMAARATDGAPGGLAPETGSETGPSADDDGKAELFSEAPAADRDGDGLPDIGPAPEAGRDRDMFATAPAIGEKASRKDLFPDIEEINSTLDSRGVEEAYDEEAAAEGRGGFSRGFFAVIFVAALAFALYLVAPRLAETIPVLEPLLSGYVDAINGARAWLDATLQGMTERISPAE